MSKILINTTASDIELDVYGVTLLANNFNYIVPLSQYTLLAEADTIAELTPFINSGDVIVNDGINNLSPSEGIEYLKYPDDAFNIRFLSDPERTNGFISKNVQAAIEEGVNTNRYFHVSDGVEQTTTSSTFLLMNNMSILPEEGTYLVILECDAQGDGVNAQGEIALFLQGVEVANSRRTLQNVITGLLSIGSNDIRSSLITIAVVQTNGTQLIQGGFRELNNDVFRIRNKSITALRLR